jgi:nucleoside-diphosphate-sugar epimerase
MDWKNKRILVTGGTGFIGSFLVERLLDAGAQVRVPMRAENYRSLSERRAEVDWMAGDLRDADYCAQLLEGVDRVFHLASCRRNAEYHEKKCGDIAAENVRMSLALIEGLREREMSIPVTFFSSANIPPSFDLLSLPKQDTIDGYALGKMLCESLWIAAAKQRKFPLLIVRPIGAYGPRDTFTVEGNVIPALMVRARDGEAEMVVWGDGTQERAFLYVEDLVDAVLRLAEEEVTGVEYLMAPEVITIRALAEGVRDLVQPGLSIRFDDAKQIGPRSVPPQPVHKVLKGFAWTSFQDGLKKTYESWK